LRLSLGMAEPSFCLRKLGKSRRNKNPNILGFCFFYVYLHEIKPRRFSNLSQVGRYTFLVHAQAVPAIDYITFRCFIQVV
jgi:hypothetical protein